MKFTPEQIGAAKAHVMACIGERVIDIAHVGSTYISGEGEDLDLVVYLQEKDEIGWGPELDVGLLNEWGYTSTGEPSGEEDEFITMRRGPVNLMVTYEREFIREFQIAAEVCKFFQGYLQSDGRAQGTAKYKLTKEARIKIHRIIMNGEDA